MFDEVFGEVIYDYGYTANKTIEFFWRKYRNRDTCKC